MIVDDEPGVRDLLRDALEIAGYQTESASNGAEALDLLRRHNADLCIVDINMPTMDGFEFLAKLREHDTQTPVLMLSARDSPVDVAKGLRFGADDYVRKPFSLEEILLRISAILRRSNAEAERRPGLERRADRDERRYATRSPSTTSRSRCRRPSSDCSKCCSSARTAWSPASCSLREVWNIDFDSETSVLDTYISYLRRKIHHDDFAPITTVRGVGFKLVTWTVGK